MGSAAYLPFLIQVLLAAAITGWLDWPAAWAIVAMVAIIAWRHESNIRRLLNGTERRVGDTVHV